MDNDNKYQRRDYYQGGHGRGSQNRMQDRSRGEDSDYGSFGRDSDFEGFRRDSDYGGYRRDDQRLFGGAPSRTGGMDFGLGLPLDREIDHTGKGPKGYRRSDDRIQEEVCEALERHPDVDATEIEILVKEGIVTLRGAVEHRRQKRMAEDAIAYLSGVKDVRNELSINQSLFQRAKELITGERSGPAKSEKTGKAKSRH